MKKRRQSSLELETPFDIFQLYANLDLTKHIGGLKATRELIELCHIDEGKYVLDAGCGVGATPCYLAKNPGCRAIGVDISERMIARANERAKRKGVRDRVEFCVADVQNLPFNDATFDAVIGESILVFIEDKKRALRECVRVTKPGGYIGFNEAIWIKSPHPELVDYLSSIANAEITTSDYWEELLLKSSRLKGIVMRIHKTSFLDELSRVKRYGLKDFLGVWRRFLSLYIRSPTYRRLLKEAPISPKKLIGYMGYGLYVGRK